MIVRITRVKVGHRQAPFKKTTKPSSRGLSRFWTTQNHWARGEGYVWLEL